MNLNQYLRQLEEGDAFIDWCEDNDYADHDNPDGRAWEAYQQWVEEAKEAAALYRYECYQDRLADERDEEWEHGSPEDWSK